MDPLALFASDPSALPLWGVFLLAVGMYPVGMLFGCQGCCLPCDACDEGELPDTITVTLDGYTDQSKSGWLCELSFESCFGTGASAVATDPGGDPATMKGPITAVTLTAPGEGYAKKGRVEPTVEAEPQEASNGTGVTFAVTLTQSLNDCKVDEWKVTKVTGKGGTGFVDEETLLFTVAEGDTEEVAAVARIRTLMEEPTLTLTVDSPDGGTGAVLTAVLEQEVGTTPARWRIDSVTVDDGGDGYAYTDTVVITLDDDSAVALEATLHLVAAHVEPTVEASIITAAGTGAALTVTLAPTTTWWQTPVVTVWEVASIAVEDAGTGYQLYEQVEVLVVDGASSGYPANAYVYEVDENGGILSVGVSGGGQYFKGGPITAVEVPYGGLYYRDSGEVEKVEIDNGGIYYREDDTLDPYVADVEVTVNQTLPSEGADAEFSVTIDEDPESETFGQITEVTIDSGGDGYLAWRYVTNDCCGWYLNGKPIVLKRSNSPGGQTYSVGSVYRTAGPECIWAHEFCGGYVNPFFPNSTSYFTSHFRSLRLEVAYFGPDFPPVAIINTGNLASSDVKPSSCVASWEADAPVTNCDEFSWTKTNLQGQTITVAPGGDYDPAYRNADYHRPGLGYRMPCASCCQGHAEVPQEVRVQINSIYQNVLPNGVYVLQRWDSWTRWEFWTPLDPLGAIQFRATITIEPGICAANSDGDPANDYGCDHCIKKCAVLATAELTYHPAVWWNAPDVDMRLCVNGNYVYVAPGSGLIARAESDALCEKLCFDVPLCRPPAGMQFSFMRVSGADGFNQFGCFNCCAPNVIKPNHLNSITMTVL